MFNQILQFVFNTLFNVYAVIIKTFFTPVITELISRFPTITTLFNAITEIANSYIFLGIRFFKMAFINLTGVSNDLLMFFLYFLGFKLYLYLTVLVAKFALNLWRTFRGSKTGTK